MRTPEKLTKHLRVAEEAVWLASKRIAECAQLADDIDGTLASHLSEFSIMLARVSDALNVVAEENSDVPQA